MSGTVMMLALAILLVTVSVVSSVPVSDDSFYCMHTCGKRYTDCSYGIPVYENLKQSMREVAKCLDKLEKCKKALCEKKASQEIERRLKRKVNHFQRVLTNLFS